MLKIRTVVLSLAAALALIGPLPASAGKPEIDPDVWIVELVDPPTVQYRGGIPRSAELDLSEVDAPMGPTAPDVTGAHKLRIDAPAVRQYSAYLDRTRLVALERISAELGREVQPRFVYRHLQNGFSARMTADEARVIAELPGVASVRPNVIQRLRTDVGPQWIGADDLWSGATGAPNPTQGEGALLGVIDSGVNWESIFFDPAESNVSVTNPRGQFYGLCNDGTLDVCNDKLIGIYDFTDEGSNGFDPDGHGTHTASTAVGVPLSLNLNFGSGPIRFDTSGVAPRASFISYKGCQAPDDGSGGFVCPGDATEAALEQAIEDGVDVVNYSIGGTAFNPWSTIGNQRLFLNLREAGIVPVVSAGNDGPGDFTVGSPANTPWVVAVANATHGRILANRLVDVSGGPFPLGELTGQGITQGTTQLPIVHARDFGNALCGTGEAELGPSCNDNTGASNPFAPGTFDGQIVVCDRGTYGRVEKGFNVLEAGAAGMILANTAAQGESTNSDQHCLPATHVGVSDGDRLRDWLASGSNHRGRLTGTQRFIDDDLAGRLNDSSSRGPAFAAPGIMKPNLTAPGTNVLAAVTETNEAGTGPGPDAAAQVGLLTGTSMSSPHVAGAALLLRAANPDWDVDAVISALETTADAGKVRNADGSTARIIDRGAGGAQVDRAAQIGLFLPVSEIEFLEANPAGIDGGDPAQLNLPGIVSENCVGTCVFRRTVEALGSGSWTASGEGDLGIRVIPQSFTLSEGQRQQLEIRVSRGRAAVGEWGAGSVVLEPQGGDFTTQRLPVGALISPGELPAPPEFTSESTRGRADVEIPALIALEELVFRTSALVRPMEREVTLSQDSTQNDAFDGPSGTTTELLQVPADALLLHARTFDSTAQDIDLYVGRDDNGDGVAQESEVRCESISPDDLERCDIETPQAGTWWVLVQNYSGSSGLFGGNDVPFHYAVFAEQADPSFVVTAPGAHDGGALSVPVYWDQPAMEADDRWLAALAVATSPDELADVGAIPVEVIRTGDNAPADTALFNGSATPVIVPGNTVHDRLFIDVPASATRLDVTVDGALAAVDIRRLPFSALGDSVPITPPAPANVLIDAQLDNGQWTATITAPVGQTIDPGRYFVVLENGVPAEQSVDVTATVDEVEGIETVRGLWGPENRAINQGLDWQVGGGGRFAVWYTYDEDRLPTFYITDTVPADPASSFFQAVLYRATSNDQRSSLKVVGEVQVTAVAEDRFMYAWRLNGHHGAEMFRPVSGTSCPDVGNGPEPLLGHWFSPTTAAGGVTLLITASSEAWIRYFYDDLNRPRWVLADRELPPTIPDGNRMEVLEFRGFCIYCEDTGVSSQVIGTLERQFIDSSTVREVSDFVTLPPTDTSVDIDRQLNRLSDPVGCSN